MDSILDFLYLLVCGPSTDYTIDFAIAWLLPAIGTIATIGFSYLNYKNQQNAINANYQNVADTNATNLAAQREANAMNYQIWQEQMAENRRYFDETNIYNSATAQVQRLKDAGLNPAMAMYGGVNAGQTSAQTAPSAPQMRAPVMQPYQQPPLQYENPTPAIADIINSFADAHVNVSTQNEQILNATLQNRLIQANANLLEEKYRTQIYETCAARFKTEFGQNEEYWKAFLNQATSSASMAMTDAMYYGKQKNLELKQLEEIGKKAFYDALISKYSSKELEVNKGVYDQLDKLTGEAAPWLSLMARSLFSLLMKSR